MTKIFLILSICIATGCQPKYSTYDFENHKFDTEVIEKFPIYDSLGKSIIKHYSAIYKPTKGEPTYVYIDYQDGDEIYKNLPPEEATKMRGYITQLGSNFFYGFNLYKDTTMRIYIRDTHLKDYHLDIRERLSFFPNGVVTKKREFTYKDTLLNNNWQYWIQFDEAESLF